MAQYRKNPLENGSLYHIYTRSIAKYQIFNDADEYDRFYKLMDLYRFVQFGYKLSGFLELSPISQNQHIENLKNDDNMYVIIVAYCLMPTHIHLILQQASDNGIEKYMAKVLNSYSRYFNTKHGRLGPLWSSRFKSVLVNDDEQLLHLSRYLHLNPSSAGIIDKPQDWIYSSYQEYINKKGIDNPICEWQRYMEIDKKQYRKFVNDRKDYQKELSKIKSLIIENYSG